MSISESLSATTLNTGYWISAGGIRDASLRLDVGAHNIANLNTNGFVPDRVESSADSQGGVTSWINPGIAQNPATSETPSQTDYPLEGIQLILAQRAFEANVRFLKSNSDAQHSLINAFA